MGLAYSELPEDRGQRGLSWDPSRAPTLTYDGSRPLWVQSRFGSSSIRREDMARGDHGPRLVLVGSCIEAVVLTDRVPSQEPEEFIFFDFGLGAPDLRRVPPGAAALDMMALAGLGSEPEPVLEIELPSGLMDQTVRVMQAEEREPEPVEPTFHFIETDDDEGLFGEILQPGLIGRSGLGNERAVVFEEGAPVYLGAGTAAGTLMQTQPLSDGWVSGDRLCYMTMFGTHFQPVLPVCFDGREARLQAPEDVAHDQGAASVVPGPVRVRGAFVAGSVEAALRRRRIDLRRCFDDARATLANHPVRVELELAIEVDGEGTVESVRRRTGELGPTIDCVIEAAKTWSMPAPTDGRPGRVVFAATVTTQR